MSNDTRNYYERELDEIDFNGEHPAKILIGSEGKTTRTLDINKESAVALIHKLTAFLIAPERADPQPTRARLYVYYTIGRDKETSWCASKPRAVVASRSRQTATCPQRTGTGSRRAPTRKCAPMSGGTAASARSAFWTFNNPLPRGGTAERAAGTASQRVRPITARQAENPRAQTAITARRVAQPERSTDHERNAEPRRPERRIPPDMAGPHAAA